MNEEVIEVESTEEVGARLSAADRLAKPARLISGLVIFASVLLLLRELPVEQWIGDMKGWIKGLGVFGPIVFGIIYVVASLLLLPGLILTIAAGALFGLVGGTITVSLASTTTAGLALLIARHGARARVEKLASTSRKFKAMDQAVSQGGWKIVAMLRLSPAVPFNLQNYFYGLTKIRFWPCVLTSWVAMLPGTLMYIYVGVLGATTLEEAVKKDPSLTQKKWLLLGLGFVATAAVTVYVTKLAGKALKEHSKVEDDMADETSKTDPDTEARPDVGSKSENKPPLKRGWTKGTSAMVVVAIVLAGVVAVPYVKRMFYPPVVDAKEKFDQEGSATFDHSAFDALLKTHVTKEGWVNYTALDADQAKLAVYIKALGEAPFKKLGRDEKLALLINAYNAFTLQLILDFDIPASIKDIPLAKRWSDVRWKVGGMTLSLEQIEHEHLRKNFVEPRIHFAINCASVGCPPLLPKAYTAANLETQLAAATAQVHVDGSRWLRFDANTNTVYLTMIYNWYRGDFERKRDRGEGLIQYVATYSIEVEAAIEAGNSVTIDWLEYDWSLNVAK